MLRTSYKQMKSNEQNVSTYILVTTPERQNISQIEPSKRYEVQLLWQDSTATTLNG